MEAEGVYASTVFYGLLPLPVVCRSAGNDLLRPWIAYPFERGSDIVGSRMVDDWLYDAFLRWKRPEFVYSWFRERRTLLMRSALRGNRHVFANSEFTADLLKTEDFGCYSVVTGGVDAAAFAPAGGGSPRPFTFLTACRLVAKKGIEVFLDAAARALRAHPGLRFVIVGDGPRRAALEQLAAPLGRSVEFTGRVAQEQMRERYWNADCFVLASREHVHPRTGMRDVETMGRVLCEANAAGVPVIAARTGGVPSIVTHGNNGLLFEPGNADELAGQMLLLAGSPEFAARLRRNGLEIARKQFDWRVVLERQEAEMSRIFSLPGKSQRDVSPLYRRT